MAWCGLDAGDDVGYIHGMAYYKLVGYHDPSRSISDPLVGSGGDAAEPVHERFGDHGLHHLRLGLRHSLATDPTGAHCMDARKFNKCCVPRPLLPDASLGDRHDAFMDSGRFPRKCGSPPAAVGAGSRNTMML